MNAKTRMLIMLLAIALTVGFFPLEQSISARTAKPLQSENSNCKHVKGDIMVNFGPGTASGTVSNGGFLNGTVETAFTPGSVVPTADPTSVTFTGVSTITTNRGVLVTQDVYLFDIATGLGSAMLRIDSAASTGDFAGATGVAYLNISSTTPESGRAELAGRICFANE